MVLKHLNPQSWSHLLVHSAQVEPVAFHVALLQPTQLMGIVGEVFQEQGQGQVRVVHLMQRPYVLSPHSTATSMLLAVDWLALAIPVTHIALATFLHGSLSSLVQSHSGGLVLEPGQQGIHSQPIQSIAKMGSPAHQKNWRDYPVHSSPKKTGGTIQSTVHQKKLEGLSSPQFPPQKKRDYPVHSSPQKKQGLSSPQFPQKKPGGTIQSTVLQKKLGGTIQSTVPKKNWRDYPVRSPQFLFSSPCLLSFAVCNYFSSCLCFQACTTDNFFPAFNMLKASAASSWLCFIPLGLLICRSCLPPDNLKAMAPVFL